MVFGSRSWTGEEVVKTAQKACGEFLDACNNQASSRTVSVLVSNPLSFDDVVIGEALAIREGLLEAISEGTLSVMVESDSLQVISYLQDPLKPADLKVAPILEDIRHIVSYLDVCSFVFISRAANSIADSLARRALSVSGRMVWPISDPWLAEVTVSDTRSSSRSLQ
ncbi:uncharacterized protein LOC122651156 [Telopea speciosissima]|uniref:uncharacterized protein LOC122651156 n=1 Tax=Telopea speciosissima TaxID=54955 RepID=UPI001CC4F592|nr:uncharacterized protein LOC122651156 [Telopea speciosissima]